MKPTIYDIKEATQVKCPFFFDRKTMRGFGQTMRSFKVVVSPKGNIYVIAPMYSRDYRTGEKRYMGLTARQFTGDDLALIPHESKADIYAYIEAN